MTLEEQIQTLWDNMAFARLLRTCRLAAAPSRLLLSLTAVLIVSLTGTLLDLVSQSVVIDTRYPAKLQLSDFNGTEHHTELDAFVADRRLLRYFIDSRRDESEHVSRQGVFTTLWAFGAARFNEATFSLLAPGRGGILTRLSNVWGNLWMCILAIFWAIRFHTLYSLFFFSIWAVTFCFLGGAICRSVALQHSRHEKPGLIEVLDFSGCRFGSLISGPVLSALTLLFFAFMIYLLGLLLNIPKAGELLLGLGLGLALFFGVLCVLMLVGTTAGGSLMLPVIACEGSDGFDAVSRSLRYVFSQPWWMLFYTLIAGLCGTISYLVARFLLYLLLIITYGMVYLGVVGEPQSLSKLNRIWPQPSFYNFLSSGPAPIGWTEMVSAVVVRITVLFVIGLLASFVISFYFSASTVIYSLMRRKIDGTGLDHVYIKLEGVFDSVDAPKDDTAETL
ncbi:MAG: hypothetical protein JXA82_07650 [Sedimentisphaerales bacterium]|nr:hypothetical protein [Sedimentisphaerales bacterium]